MISSRWQRLRSSFNHDWLKNGFLPAMAKFVNLLDERLEDRAFEAAFVERVLPEWEHHREDAFALSAGFEQAMSPRRLFDRPPLARCDAETQQWLGDLVHALWMARYPVRQWMDTVAASAKSADAAYNELQRALRGCADTGSAQALRPLRPLFASFRYACHQLAKAIEQFPSEVRVT